MSKDVFTFPTEKTDKELEKMTSDEVANESVKLSTLKDDMLSEYSLRMKRYHELISKKITEEKAERDKNPAHKALEQGVGG